MLSTSCSFFGNHDFWIRQCGYMMRIGFILKAYETDVDRYIEIRRSWTL